MKCLVPILLTIFVLFGCGDSKKNQHITHEQKSRPTVPAKQRAWSRQDSLKEKGQQVLKALKQKDYKLFSQYFSKSGVYFSPYGFIDNSNCKKLSSTDFLEALQENWILTWGSYDGSGNKIRLTVTSYLEKFVYNADYLQADRISFNEIVQKGNTLINIHDVFPNHPFIEYHFKGFDKRYAGMDWTSLILVFGKEAENNVLVGIIHHQWTI